MVKKWVMLIAITSLLIGCSNDKELESYKVELDEINSVLEQRNKEIERLKYREDTMIQEHQTVLNELTEKRVLLEEELELLQLENDTLNASLNEQLDNNDLFISDFSVLASSLKHIENARYEFRSLKDDVITRAEAMSLYTQAQYFHEDNFIHDMFATLSPKSDYDYYTEMGFDLELLDHWYLMDNNDKPMTKDTFDDIILTYFTEDVLETYTAQYIGVLDVEALPERWPRFLVYKDHMLKRWMDGGSSHEEKLLVNQSILTLVSISETKDAVVYKAIIPQLHFDFVSGNFESVDFVEEMLEFKKTDAGWRLNGIPKSYIQ